MKQRATRSRWGVLVTRLLIALVCLFSLRAGAVALAHPGGLDAYGGHNDHVHGGYHFHRGPLAGQSFATKEEALAALAAAERGADSTKAQTALPPHQGDRVEALIRLLERKGIITEKELANP